MQVFVPMTAALQPVLLENDIDDNVSWDLRESSQEQFEVEENWPSVFSEVQLRFIRPELHKQGNDDDDLPLEASQDMHSSHNSEEYHGAHASEMSYPSEMMQSLRRSNAVGMDDFANFGARAGSLGTASCEVRRARKLLNRCSSGDMEPDLMKVLSFRGSEYLLRASRLTSVMRHGAAIYSRGKGTAETFALSERVATIDVFISHNWDVHRAHKFAFLVLHFNLRFLFVATAVVMAVVAAATSLGIRPFVLKVPIIEIDPSAGDIEYSPAGILLTTPLSLLAVCFGHELQRLAGWHGCTVFLDKTCIDQVDLGRQEEGIRRLGAFVRSSSRMVAMYTDIYLTKLWTVYEVACFLSLHHPSRLHVIPNFQPLVVFGGAASVYFGSLMRTAAGSLRLGLGLAATAAGLCVGIIEVAILLRFWARVKEKIRKRVENFSVDDCTCFCEDDRPLVNRNIASLMRVTGEVNVEAPEQEALEAFNCIVRRRLSKSLTASIGPLGLGYLQVVAIFAPSILPMGADFFAFGALQSQGEWVTRFRVAGCLWYIAVAFGIYPSAVAFLAWWCGRCVHLRRCQEVIYVCLGGLLLWVGMIVQYAVCERLFWSAVYGGSGRGRALSAATLASICVLSIPLAMFMFTSGRRVGNDEEEEEDCEEESPLEEVEGAEAEEESRERERRRLRTSARGMRASRTSSLGA